MNKKRVFLIVIIFLFALYCSFNYFINNANNITEIIYITLSLSLLLSMLFALIKFESKTNFKLLITITTLMFFNIIGISFIKFGNLDLFYFLRFENVILINILMATIPVIYFLIILLNKFIHNSKLFYIKINKNKFVFIFALITVFIATIYFSLYGSSGFSRSYSQQIINLNNFGKISDNLPIGQNLYVFLINIFIQNNINIIILYFTQIIIYSVLVSSILYSTLKNGINKFVLFIILILAILNPLIYYNLFSVSEIVCSVLFVLYLINYIINNKVYYNFKFVLVNILLSIWVKNGLILSVLLLLYSLIINKNVRKNLICIFSIVITAYIIFNNINIINTTKQNNLISSPIIKLQTARYIAHENINENDKLSLSGAYNINQISKFYNGENLNTVLEHVYNDTTIQKQHTAFLTYIRLVNNSPKTAIQAFLNQSSPYFVFGENNMFFINNSTLPKIFGFIISPAVFIWSLIIIGSNLKGKSKKENKLKIILFYIILNILFSGYASDVSISFYLYTLLPIYISYYYFIGSQVAQNPKTSQKSV